MNIRTAFISLVGMSAILRMASAMPSFFPLHSAPSSDSSSSDSSVSDQFGVARDSGGREFPEHCLNSPLEFKFDKDTIVTCLSIKDKMCEDPRRFARERVQTHCSRSCSNRLGTECVCDDSTAPFFFEESITRCEDEIVGENCDKVQISRTCPRTCRKCPDQFTFPDYCENSPFLFKVQGETLSCPFVEDEDCNRARTQSHCSKRCAKKSDTSLCECSDSTAPFWYRDDWRFCGTGFILSYCDKLNIQKTCPLTCGVCPSIALSFTVEITIDNGSRISSSVIEDLVRSVILAKVPTLCDDERRLNQVSRGSDTLAMKVNEKSSGDFEVTVSVYNSHDQNLSDIANMRISVLNGSLSAAIADQASMAGVTAAVSSELLTHEPFDLTLPGNQPNMNNQPSHPPSGAPLDDPSLFKLNLNVADAGSSAADIENFIRSAVEEMFPNLDFVAQTQNDQGRHLRTVVPYRGFNVAIDVTAYKVEGIWNFKVDVYIYDPNNANEAEVAILKSYVSSGQFDIDLLAAALDQGIEELEAASRLHSESPSSSPSNSPSSSSSPSSTPSAVPSAAPSSAPSNTPSVSPSDSPSSSPSSAPSAMPSAAPSDTPSNTPSVSPSDSPSSSPSSAPSAMPSAAPSSAPSESPSESPSSSPSSAPSAMPSLAPSSAPSAAPSISSAPSPQAVGGFQTTIVDEDNYFGGSESAVEDFYAALIASLSVPSANPSSMPSLSPSGMPSLSPSSMPSGSPEGSRRYLRPLRSLPTGEELTVTRVSENEYVVRFVVSSPQDSNFMGSMRESIYNGELLSAIYNQASLLGYEHLFIEVEEISNEPSSVTMNVPVNDEANRTAATFSETSGGKLSTSPVKTAGLLPKWATIWMSILSALLACMLVYLAYTSWAKKQVLD